MYKQGGTDPRTVLSPRSNWELEEVLYECDDWSMAMGRWLKIDGQQKPVLALRWNGWSDEPKGNPTSRGFPTWFILPSETFELYINSEFIAENKRNVVTKFLDLNSAK